MIKPLAECVSRHVFGRAFVLDLFAHRWTSDGALAYRSGERGDLPAERRTPYLCRWLATPRHPAKLGAEYVTFDATPWQRIRIGGCGFDAEYVRLVGELLGPVDWHLSAPIKHPGRDVTRSLAIATKHGEPVAVLAGLR